MKKRRKIAIKKKGKPVYAMKKKAVKKRAAKRARRAYNQQMGTLSGREVAAQAIRETRRTLPA